MDSRSLRFVVHFLELAVAMAVGMFALDVLWAAILPAVGSRVDVYTVVMATDMALGMALWMVIRGRSWARILEMCVAVYVPFLILLPLFWAGAVSVGTLMLVGHVLLVPAIIMVMLWRRSEYTSSWRRDGRRRFLWVGALVLAFAVPPAVVGTVRAVTYLNGVYEPPADSAVPALLGQARPVHDPSRPTAVVLLGNEGANAGDSLAPYETLAATGAFNLYTVAPQRRLVTLTGGLDLVPDLSFAELDQRLGAAAPEVIVVPALPDATEPTSAALRGWLGRMHDNGATVISVCEGAAVVAAAGVLDGHGATTHWFRINGLEKRHPAVRWQRETRYVDDGDVISTGGVLSGIDGTLRYVERRLGIPAARDAASAVGWKFYSPGKPAPLPHWTFGPREMITGVNLSFRPHQDIGVLLTDGVGEIELASVFIAYSDVSYVARTSTLGNGSVAPVRTRHGLTFVPRGTLAEASGLDRFVVPGAQVARRNPVPDAAGVRPEYVHREPDFAFELVLEDMARTVDVPTARWRAKTLEYPPTALDLHGPGWPWGATLLPVLYGLLGVGAAVALRSALRRTRRPETDRTPH